MMKKLIYLGAIVLMASCSSNKYENAMSNYLQTVDNVKTDLKFKLIEAKEAGTITANDSLEHFRFHWATWKKSHEEMAKASLEQYKALKEANWDLKEQRESLQKNVDNAQSEYDSYINDTFEYTYGDNGIAKYSAIPADQVLANKVECKYSIFNPLAQVQQEITETYVLSPDGAVCYGIFKPLTEIK